MSCLTSLISTISPLPEFIPAGVISDFRDLLDSPFPIVVFGSSAARPSDRVGSPETAGRSRMPALPSGRQSRQVWDGRRCCTRRAETAGFPLSFSPRCGPGGDPDRSKAFAGCGSSEPCRPLSLTPEARPSGGAAAPAGRGLLSGVEGRNPRRSENLFVPSRSLPLLRRPMRRTRFVRGFVSGSAAGAEPHG